MCGVNDLGYNLISLKDVLKLRVSKYIHGEIRMYGQSGSVLEKAAKTFGRGVFIGHIHYPAIRFGCYSVGFTGLMDQEYNEPNASRWMHGIGLNNEFEKKSFETTIAIINSKCLLGGKVFAPKNPKSWDVKSYKAKLVYDVKGC